jgi:outer membrane protein TolC
MKFFCLNKILKPTASRFLLAVSVVSYLASFAAPVEASSAEPLTVDRAVQSAVQRSALEKSWSARIFQAEATAKVESAWPNPTLSADREQTFENDSVSSEDFFVLEQMLPVWGTRSLRQKAAEASTRAQVLANKTDRLNLEAKVRHTFYRVLRNQRKLEATRIWRDHLREAVDKIRAKVAANEASRFQLRQLRARISDVESDMALLEADLRDSKGKLAGLIGGDRAAETLMLEGRLRPDSVPGFDFLSNQLAEHPKRKRLEAEISSQKLQQNAVSRSLWPTPVVRGGYRRVDPVTDQIFHGFVAGISLELPVFSQREGERERVVATQQELTATRQRFVQKRKARLEALHATAEQLVDTARDYQDKSLSRAKKQSNLVLRRWDAGEARLTDLIRTYENHFETRQRLIELNWEARRRVVELKEIAGSFE